jgi:hypothetical protein
LAEGNYPLRQANRSTMNHGEIVSFIWSVADLTRDSFKRGKYQDIILSLTVLRRLDCVLAPTKQKVLKRQAELRGKGLQDLALSQMTQSRGVASSRPDCRAEGAVRFGVHSSHRNMGWATQPLKECCLALASFANDLSENFGLTSSWHRKERIVCGILHVAGPSDRCGRDDNGKREHNAQ